ncbi:MAG: VacJ family lipoprotein [Acidobacteriota bacterium]
MKIRIRFISVAMLCIILVPLYSFAEEDLSDGQSVTSVSDGEPTGGPDETMQEEGGMADPLEPWNRAMFTFNDRLYFWVMKPTAKLYSFFVPEWGRIRIRNAVNNVAFPVRFVNSILQFRFHAAVAELGRFVVNSTAGVGGMFEIVKANPDIGTGDKDMGQTLGRYGISDGFYFIWPLLGPSSFRDSIGMVGDGFLIPENYITPLWDSVALHGYERVNDVSMKIGDYEDFKESAVEPYIAMRNAYYQYRKSKVEGGEYTGPLYQEKDRQ